MKVLSIINLKGGVAKTISSVNMAHILAAVHGCKVLLIDNDKQGNASKILNLLTANLEVMLDQSRPQQTRFKKFLDGIQSEYDYCIIDNAPDINISTINALVASNDVMVPITIDDFAIDGLAELKEQSDHTREDLNPGLRFCGCFVTQYDRTNEADTQGEEFLKTLEYPLFETHIRRTPKMKPSTFERKPIIVYSSRCGAAYDYKALVQEYLRM